MIDARDCELSTLREQVGSLRETKAAVIGELDASNSRLSRTSEEVDMLQKELRLKTEMLETERCRLEAVLEEMSSVQQEASAHAERLQAEMQQAQQSLEARDDQIAGLEARMDEAALLGVTWRGDLLSLRSKSSQGVSVLAQDMKECQSLVEFIGIELKVFNVFYVCLL